LFCLLFSFLFESSLSTIYRANPQAYSFMPKFSSAEEAIAALGQRIGGLESLSEPIWGTRQTGPMRNFGYVIGRRNPENTVGYRYNYDAAIGFHINVFGVPGFDHLVLRNGNSETRIQYWEQLTASFRYDVPADVVRVLRDNANGTTSHTDATRTYAIQRANALEILDQIRPSSGW
jgi:hypothetical protein